VFRHPIPSSSPSSFPPVLFTSASSNTLPARTVTSTSL
jgi:hypothetical protein